jgi:hypothetical protein
LALGSVSDRLCVMTVPVDRLRTIRDCHGSLGSGLSVRVAELTSASAVQLVRPGCDIAATRSGTALGSKVARSSVLGSVIPGSAAATVVLWSPVKAQDAMC